MKSLTLKISLNLPYPYPHQSLRLPSSSPFLSLQFLLPTLPFSFTLSSLFLSINSFIHSFILAISIAPLPPSSPLPLRLRGAPDYSTDTVSEFHAEAHRQL